jgi:hypothetical protein
LDKIKENQKVKEFQWKCYIPNIIFNSLISILAVNPDLLNIASIFFIILFTEGHLKNRCPDKLKIKVIRGIFKQNIKPKCQIKWEEQYGGNIDWTQNLDKIKENQSY